MKKIRQVVQSQLTRLDLVNREEFDVQTQVLLRTREKLALLEQIENETAEADARASLLNEIEASPADNASVRTLNALVSEAAEHNLAQLTIIRHALAKCADGSYGLCDNCGEAIGLSRLNARPEARLCIDCQTRLEKARRGVA